MVPFHFHKSSWIYLTSTYYCWLLRPTITIRFDSKFQIIAEVFDSKWRKHCSHGTNVLCVARQTVAYDIDIITCLLDRYVLWFEFYMLVFMKCFFFVFCSEQQYGDVCYSSVWNGGAGPAVRPLFLFLTTCLVLADLFCIGNVFCVR